jgi:hypothetical protein
MKFMGVMAVLAVLVVGCANSGKAKVAVVDAADENWQGGRYNRQIVNDPWAFRIAVLSVPLTLGAGMGLYIWLKRSKTGNKLLYGKKYLDFPNRGPPSPVGTCDAQTQPTSKEAFQTPEITTCQVHQSD